MTIFFESYILKEQAQMPGEGDVNISNVARIIKHCSASGLTVMRIESTVWLSVSRSNHHTRSSATVVIVRVSVKALRIPTHKNCREKVGGLRL